MVYSTVCGGIGIPYTAEGCHLFIELLGIELPCTLKDHVLNEVG